MANFPFPVRSARPLLAALCVAGLALLSGCKSSYADICKAQAQCSGGNDADISACEALGHESQKVADAYDCGDAYDKVLECVKATGTCKGGKYSTDCSAEGSALAACEKAASAKGGASAFGADSNNSSSGTSGGGNGGNTSCGVAGTCQATGQPVSQCVTTNGAGKCMSMSLQIQGGASFTCASCTNCTNAAAEFAKACSASAPQADGGAP
jgi:hypothetical protein